MKRLIFALLISLALHTASYADETAARAERDPNPVIRVCIIDGNPSIQLSLKGAFKITAIDNGRTLLQANQLDAKVSATQGGLLIGDAEFKTSGVSVNVEKDSTIYVDGTRFRGDIDIVRKDNSRLMVVNHIPVDDYLYGVLHYEVSDRWPIAALKAQAIAARSFALYQAKQNKLQPYDLRSDIYSQVYGGSASEKWATTKAVNLTKAKVLTYKGELLPAYYHATCAGYTENAAALWNIDMPPLGGVKCDYCTQSPHYKWTKEIPLSQLEEKLKKSGYNLNRLASVTVLSQNQSGRVDKLEIKDSSGVSAIITAKDFRQLIGPNEVRSTRFNTSIKHDRLVLTGLGWGHGVGMCQWGAYGYAKKGATAEDILKLYYPGAQITTLDKLKNKP